MSNIIKCDKCGRIIPNDEFCEKDRATVTILTYRNDKTNYSFDIDFCCDCVELFKKWMVVDTNDNKRCNIPDRADESDPEKDTLVHAEVEAGSGE